MNKFRPYQDRDYGFIKDEFEKFLSVLYQAPTGTGKSVVIEKLKEPSFVVEEINEDWFSKDEVEITNKKGINIEIKFKKDQKEKFLNITNNSRHMYSYSKKDAMNQLGTNIIIGKLSSEFLKEKTYKHVLDLFEEIADLQQNKINISELEKKAEEFQKQQLLIKLRQYIITNNEVKLPNGVNLNRYFPRDYYRYEKYEKYTKIKFSKNKLQSTNSVVFISGTSKVEKHNVKPDKLIEILEDANWK